LLFVLPAAVFAQTAENLDAVLEAKQVSFAQAAAVILPAAGLLPPNAGPDAAFERAREWLPRRAEGDKPIRMGELAHLVMRSFGLSGGFLYALFPGPRYAYRALAWRRFLPLNPGPYRTLSGEELLYITGQALSHVEEPDAASEPAPETGSDAGLSQGLSSGPEGVIPYQGEFERE
jgi:hypothetical protein